MDPQCAPANGKICLRANSIPNAHLWSPRLVGLLEIEIKSPGESLAQSDGMCARFRLSTRQNVDMHRFAQTFDVIKIKRLSTKTGHKKSVPPPVSPSSLPVAGDARWSSFRITAD